MNQSDFLRMQIIMNDSAANSFDTNLSKLVSVVLFSLENGLTAFGIQKKLKDSYDLEFTEEEISKAVEKAHSGIEKLSSKTTLTKHGKEFTTQAGYNTVVNVLKKILLAKKGLILLEFQMPKVTSHVCRHTYCSNMAKPGMNPQIL